MQVTLTEILSRVENERLELSDGFRTVLRAALQWFHRNAEVAVSDLSADHVRAMMRALLDQHRSHKTVNNYRYAILFLWEQARQDGAPSVPWLAVRPLRKIHRKPTAWTTEQLQRLIDACREAQTLRGWGPVEWEAITSTVYDTSLRIGCLLRLSLQHLISDRPLLYVPGEFQKGREDTLQPLHPHTVRLLLRIDRSDHRLFPWPFHQRLLWEHYERHILIPAGLPHTSRDKFHKIRRTSYTYVAKRFGVAVASDHAAHKSDMSRYYLDTSLLDRPNPLDALPRMD